MIIDFVLKNSIIASANCDVVPYLHAQVQINGIKYFVSCVDYAVTNVHPMAPVRTMRAIVELTL